MHRRTLSIGAVSALLVWGLAIVALAAEEEKAAPDTTFQLHFTLRLDESGEPKLYLETPTTEEFLYLLLNGLEKHPPAILNASKSIPHGVIVRAIDRLGSLGLRKISLDTTHDKAAPNKRVRTAQ